MDGVRGEPHSGQERLVGRTRPVDPADAHGTRATALFSATGLMVAIVVASVHVSGWHAGVLDDRVEWVFWAGAILGALGVTLLGVAAIPGRSGTRTIGAGVVLFLLAPVLCVVAVFTDYWILMAGTELNRQREHLATRAVVVFVGYLTAMAIVCGGVIVSGWFAGVLDDPPERVFWAGAMLAGFTNVVFCAAAFPGWRDDAREVARVLWTMRVGLVLAILSPALCIGSLIVDFYT